MSRFATWNGTVRPKSVTGMPNGITENARNAGTIARTGAITNTGLSALVGVIPSLKKSLMPSARVTKIPRGPARIGPLRVWKSAITLRSIHTYRSTEINNAKNTTTTRAINRSQSSQSISSRLPPRPPPSRARRRGHRPARRRR